MSYERIRYVRSMPLMTSTSVPALVLDPSTAAWVAAVVSAGGSVSGARQSIVDALIIGLKADGLFTKLDRLWLFAAENTQSALVDIIALATATATNSPTFTADDGYNGNGSTSFVDSNFVPGVTSGNYAQDSASIGIWSVTAGANGNPRIGWVNAGASVSGSITCNDVGGSGFVGGVINSNLGTSIFDGTSAAKFGLVSRTAAALTTIYNDGTSQNTDANGSTLSGGVDIYLVGGRNFNGTLNQPTDAQIAAGCIGGGLDSTDASNLWNRLRTYMTAVGVP